MAPSYLFRLVPLLFIFSFIYQTTTVCQGLPRWLSGKGSAANAGNGPWGPDSPLEKEMATQLQYFYLENPMDGRARQATVHGVARSRT